MNITQKSPDKGKSAKKRIILSLIAIMVIIIVLPIIMVNIPYKRESGTETPGTFYQNEKVLVLMPHQDDEIYGVASTIINYIRAGSEVVVAYSTNGDYY